MNNFFDGFLDELVKLALSREEMDKLEEQYARAKSEQARHVAQEIRYRKQSPYLANKAWNLLVQSNNKVSDLSHQLLEHQNSDEYEGALKKIVKSDRIGHLRSPGLLSDSNVVYPYKAQLILERIRQSRMAPVGKSFTHLLRHTR